ncbi:MAG: Lrp/AsnC family transcriptional regulator [Fibrobacter sp.]|nr:Lrp/AsnC family transcriptional regulator [Fibrobacter sp.]
MTELEQRLLSIIQDDFPLEERPYRRLAEMLNAQEQTVYDAVENLRQSGIIRRIGGIYDSHKLGFISRLCAGKVNDLEKFAATVNAIPAITHNYVRSHEYNVWFTAIAESEEEIRKIVDGLCASTDLHNVHILSATKKFKINTVMTRHPGGTGVPVDDCVILSDPCKGESKDSDPQSAQTRVLSADDRARIRIACDDIPHTLTPFTDWNVSVDELREDLAQRRMRRFGAILRHQDAGFAHNAMICFKVDSNCVILSNAKDPDPRNSAGTILAQKPYISHCYERPAFEGFPYTLYAMMHAQSAAELDAFIKEAANSIGNPDYVVLHSVCELKKTSFRFF